MRKQLDPLGPGQGGVDVAVDLGEHAVQDQVLELLLVAHVAVERPGDHSEARGQVTHGQRLDALLGDDRERLGHHALAGERRAALLLSQGTGDHSERGVQPVARSSVGAVCGSSFTSSLLLNQGR
jgi:hypothetical protein